MTSGRLLVTYSSTRDSDIWQDLKTGDQRALDHIYYNNASALMAYGKQFTSHSALVDDCIQELFVDLWIKRHRIAEVTSIRAYLMKSLKRRIIRALQKESKNLYFADMGIQFGDLPEFGKMAIQVKYGDNHLMDSLNRLSSLQKEIVFLKFYNGLSFEEIEEVLQLHRKQLYNALAKAMAKLRKLLKQGPPPSTL